MLGKTLLKGFDKGRLKSLLAFFFIALAVPTAVLIWQAYSQLKWEAFHQYRGMAEELTNRIDASLIDGIKADEARSFADYTFLVVSGDPSANFVQRSPLSEFPVAQALPGVIGYFQVGTAGEFSTPLLPQRDVEPASFGIGPDEYEQRLQLAKQIQEILGDNRLVRHQPTGVRRGIASSPASPAVGSELVEAEEEADSVEDRQRQVAEVSPRMASHAVGDKDQVNRRYAMPEEQAPKPNEDYSQSVFDELNSPKKSQDDHYAVGGFAGEVTNGTLENKERLNTLGKVADLKLDAAYQRKSEVAEQMQQEEQFRDNERVDAAGRSKRREQIALPESGRVAMTAAARRPAAKLAGPADLRISTFESEIDPLEFSLLDSGHFVLFRKVWRDGERYIQGLLINQHAFVRGAFGMRFHDTGLSDISNLIVAYQDDVLHTLTGNRYSDYPNSSQAFDGALLYRSRLSAPLESLELIYSINGLPPGPGATVLGWVTLVLTVVFLGGFYTLYRLGLSQINLARQQQDFVAAVSHELKTPLTSIRMYGEMLKEGWAEPDKRQQYYEFIHDESERLTRLISNVLQLAKITRNEPQFDLKPVTVGELMNQIESKISSQVQHAGFELEFQKDEQADKASINIDEDCFAQIVINLVDNAIKFSKGVQEKRIEISSKLSSENTAIFAVRDFGPGVPKDQMKKIFKLFYRSESELTRETVGTGIGLAIVHQLSVAMQGKVDVLNREPGAEFRISFPITVA
ncbi:MAG: HAMP domain-containing histidine kinase [Alphaproteobacteria bacterium]|nr:HAMP domain-containing histidine kinase [Alphaproteobacteria bacterium]